ncbi:MAG: helix-turn-helix transcriptional regulator [Bacteroidota bacterium]
MLQPVGISQMIVGKCERSEAIPAIEPAEKIADAFGVSLGYFVGKE